jgi:hypothetical protein
MAEYVNCLDAIDRRFEQIVGSNIDRAKDTGEYINLWLGLRYGRLSAKLTGSVTDQYSTFDRFDQEVHGEEP